MKLLEFHHPGRWVYFLCHVSCISFFLPIYSEEEHSDMDTNKEGQYEDVDSKDERDNATKMTTADFEDESDVEIEEFAEKDITEILEVRKRRCIHRNLQKISDQKLNTKRQKTEN